MAKKYSAKERKAFHMGRAWAAGKAGNQINCPGEKTKQSFRNGVKATRQGKSGGGKNGVKTDVILLPLDKSGKQCIEVSRKTGEILRVVNCGGK